MFLFFNIHIPQLAGLPHQASNSQRNSNTPRSYPAVPEGSIQVPGSCSSQIHRAVLPVAAPQLKSDTSGKPPLPTDAVEMSADSGTGASGKTDPNTTASMGSGANGHATEPGGAVTLPIRTDSSNSSLPPPGQTLTGKQEHCSSPPQHTGPCEARANVGAQI